MCGAPCLIRSATDQRSEAGRRLWPAQVWVELSVGFERKEDRNESICEAVRIHRLTLSEVGDYVGLRYLTISMIAKQQFALRHESEE